MSFVSKIKSGSLTGVVQRLVTIDKKHDVDDAVFLTDIPEGRTRNNLVLVGSSCVYSISFDLGSTAAYSQYC